MYKLYVFFAREGATLSVLAYIFLFLDEFKFYKKEGLTMMRFYIITVLIFTLNHCVLIYVTPPRQKAELLLFGALAAKTGYKILQEQYTNHAHREKPLYLLCSGLVFLIGILMTIFSIYTLISRYF